MSGLKLTLSASSHGSISYKWLRPSTTATVRTRGFPTLHARPLRPQIYPSPTSKTLGLMQLIKRGGHYNPNCVSYSSTADPHDRGETSSQGILANRSMEPSENGKVERLLRDDDSDPKNSHHPSKLLTLPTILTIGRVAAVPLLVSTFYMDSWWATTATTSIFIAAAITDWLDGYLARKMKQGTAFGAFLDPVADKLMVAATLVLLCTRPLELDAVGQVPWLMTIPAVAIIGREITMSAVREWAASKDRELLEAVAVNNLGKWKTATQMIALAILLATRDSRHRPLSVTFDRDVRFEHRQLRCVPRNVLRINIFSNANSDVHGFNTGVGGLTLVASGMTLLYISAGLAVWSLVVYMRKIWKVLLK